MTRQGRGLRFVSAGVLCLSLWGVSGMAASKTDETALDKAIQAMIEHRLESHGLTEEAKIKVAVGDHTITLTGSVPTLGAKAGVEDEAGGVEESYRVVNDLVVSPGFVPDAAIMEELRTRILHHVFYSIFDWIEFRVNNGDVTLIGWVTEPWHKTEFVKQAERVKGVRHIDDQIKVLPASLFDEQLRWLAARAIYGHPMFESYATGVNHPIHIVVNNGNITLEGVVLNQLEKKWAEELVRSNVDAFSVVNDLEIAKG